VEEEEEVADVVMRLKVEEGAGAEGHMLRVQVEIVYVPIVEKKYPIKLEYLVHNKSVQSVARQ
jgi:hypothetical protein